jgi:hypothetical protein
MEFALALFQNIMESLYRHYAGRWGQKSSKIVVRNLWAALFALRFKKAIYKIKNVPGVFLNI